MKFEEYSISNEIKTNLKELGFKRPTDIQYKAIPPILKGEDVLASFMLPPLQVVAAGINFLTLLFIGKHLFDLPFLYELEA